MIIVPTIFFVFYRCVGSFFLKKTNMYRANWQRMRLIKHQVHCIPMDHHHQPPIARAHIEFCFPGSRGLLRHKQMALWFDSIESFRCCSSTETVASCLPPPPPPQNQINVVGQSSSRLRSLELAIDRPMWWEMSRVAHSDLINANKTSNQIGVAGQYAL